MYLIILLGVVGKLALVSGECDLGTPKLENVDWNELTGNWYLFYHTSNNEEDNYVCVLDTYEFSNKRMSVYTIAYDESNHHVDTIYGELSNFTTNGYYDNISTNSFWTGRYLLLAIERDSYFIMTFCPKQGGNRIAHMAFRNWRPDEATLEKAFKSFNETGLDASQLVKWRSDNC